jgi:hypothetical protein
MSTALIRGNMLTHLGNRGTAAVEEADRLLREFLADKPGPWLPEDFFAPHELVERSIDAATPEGKHTLLRLLHQLVSELFFVIELEARRLNESESRQLLGAMTIISRHPILRGSRYTDVVEFAARRPELFWNRVTAFPEIVSDRERFIKILIGLLPKKCQKQIQAPLARQRNFLESIGRLVGIASQDTDFKQAYFKGEAVQVEVTLNGSLVTTGVVRINKGHSVFVNGDELEQIAKRRKLPHKNLGEVAIAAASASVRNIRNATLSRLNDSFDTSLARR